MCVCVCVCVCPYVCVCVCVTEESLAALDKHKEELEVKKQTSK